MLIRTWKTWTDERCQLVYLEALLGACKSTAAPSFKRDIGRDLCVSVVIWASRQALGNGEIIRIYMGKKTIPASI